MNRNRIWIEQELYPEERCPYILLFADTGDGDYFAFDMRCRSNTGEYPVLDGDHNFSPEEWNTISDSFTDWLTAFVEAEGRMFWS